MYTWWESDDNLMVWYKKDARIFPSFAQFSFWPWVKGTHFEGSPHWQGVLLQRTLPFSAHSILWSHTKAHWGIKPNHPIIHSPSSRQWRLPFVARTFRRRQMSRFAFSKASIINSTWSMQYQCTVFCSSPVQFHSAYWTTGLHDLGGFKSSTLTKAHARLSDSVTAPTFWDFEDRLSAFRKIQEKHNCYVHVAGHSLGKNRQFQWVQCGPQTSKRVQALSQRQRHWLLHQPSRIAEMLLLSCDPLCTTASQYHPKVNSLCPICGLHRWPLLPRPCFLPGRQMEASRTDRTSRPKAVSSRVDPFLDPFLASTSWLLRSGPLADFGFPQLAFWQIRFFQTEGLQFGLARRLPCKKKSQGDKTRYS